MGQNSDARSNHPGATETILRKLNSTPVPVGSKRKSRAKERVEKFDWLLAFGDRPAKGGLWTVRSINHPSFIPKAPRALVQCSWNAATRRLYQRQNRVLMDRFVRKDLLSLQDCYRLGGDFQRLRIFPDRLVHNNSLFGAGVGCKSLGPPA